MSCSSKISMASIISGVFFHALAATTSCTHTVHFYYILSQQLLASVAYRMRIEAQRVGQLAVAPCPSLATPDRRTVRVR